MRRRRFITGAAATLALSPVATRALDVGAPAPPASTAPLPPPPTTADAVGWLGHAPPARGSPRRPRRDEPETP